MRASRLLSLLLLLQTRGQLAAPELAAELEVSVRTVYRDIESLSAAGVPIYAERGPAGGFRLLEGYRTRLTGLSADEAAALGLAGLPGPAAELGLGELLAAAELKLLAALPATLRERAERLRERFHLDAPGWFYDAGETPHLAAVATAVREERPLHVIYRRAGRAGVVERTLEPLGLILKGGAWYLAAAADGEPRAYRVERILELMPLEGRFDRPADFDLAAFWGDWSRRFESLLYRGEATIRLSPRGQELFQYRFASAVTRALAATATPPDADGWITATIPVETEEKAAGDLLQLGANAEVLSPPTLRARLAAEVAALARHYAPPDKSPSALPPQAPAFPKHHE